MLKATWPQYAWEIEADGGKVCRSSDGRVVIRMTPRYGVPETWTALVTVYGPSGCAGERQGWFEVTLEAPFDEALKRVNNTMLASGVVAEVEVVRTAS